MCIPVHSPWLPGNINVVQTVLIVLAMAGLFLDRPRGYHIFIQSLIGWTFEGCNATSTRQKACIRGWLAEFSSTEWASTVPERMQTSYCPWICRWRLTEHYPQLSFWWGNTTGSSSLGETRAFSSLSCREGCVTPPWQVESLERISSAVTAGSWHIVCIQRCRCLFKPREP